MDVSLFDLRADPEAMRGAASGWRTLAVDVGDSWYEVARKRVEVVGDTWSGDAAESYRAHAGTFAGDLYDGRLAMHAIADALESAADDTAEAQRLLNARLSAVAGLFSLPSVIVGQLNAEDLAAALEAAEDDARQIRSSLDEALRTHRDDIMDANSTLRQVGDRWLPVAAGETTGWAPPPGATGVFGVIQVGDRLVVNIPDGVFPEGWWIDVITDPETGEQVLRAYEHGSDVVVEFFRAQPGTDLVIRTGASYGWIDLGDGGDNTLIGSPGDDVVLAGSGTTVVGLGGDDRISGDVDGRFSGGAGDDDLRTANYGSGGFEVYGGLGNDRASINSSRTYVSGGEGGDDVTSPAFAADDDGDSHNEIDGGAGQDTLTALTGGNTLRGGPGDDNLVTVPDDYSGEPEVEPDHVMGQGGLDFADIDEDDTATGSTEHVDVSR